MTDTLATSTKPTLGDLHRRTVALLRTEHSITRGLDWADEVLPVFPDACAESLRQGDTAGVAAWLALVDGDADVLIHEAGGTEVSAWRIDWLNTYLRATQALAADRTLANPGRRLAFIETLRGAHPLAPAAFPVAFWHHLIDVLSSGPGGDAAASARPARALRVAFPLVLTEPVVDGGAETNVVMAEFELEETGARTGEVYLHPRQALLRCMDGSFAAAFAQAAAAVRSLLGPDALVRSVAAGVATVKPKHERFLTGMTLRGGSGAGALAVGLCRLHGRGRTDEGLAISFGLVGQGAREVDGRCHSIGAAEDKVRGCAKIGIGRLLVAKSQQTALAAYARRMSVELIGADTLDEAVAAASGNGRAAAAAGKQVTLLYCHHAEQDRYLSRLLEEELAHEGHQVFVDRQIPIGLPWAQEIERRIREADAVVALLSSAAAASEMLPAEIRIAHEARQANGSRPRLLPVRIAYDGPLPAEVDHILSPLQHAVWSGPADDDRLVACIREAVVARSELPPATDEGRAAPSLLAAEGEAEEYGGVVPLGSRYYVERDTDRPFIEAIEAGHSIVLAKGARQMGKSSLLVRGLDHVERRGVQVALTDFQRLSLEDVQSSRAFYIALARMLCRALGVPASLEDAWAPGRSANLNFEEFMEDHVLEHTPRFVWAMDEADRLFATPFCSDVFGLFRSWANERQGRPGSCWSGLTMVISYATEAHLFIQDVTQSPFNVGTRFELHDFTLSQVAGLNARYGSPLRDEDEVAGLHSLVGGHPYLVRRALRTMVRDGVGLAVFAAMADRDEGPLGDHLRRLLTLLARSDDNRRAMQSVLGGGDCPSYEAFYHLRSAGLLAGISTHDARVRCDLYARYLARHLL